MSRFQALTNAVLDTELGPVKRPVGARLALSDAEIRRLAAVLNGGFDPPLALCAALANLARADRCPPTLHWPSAA